MEVRILLELICGFWAPHAGWGSTSGFLLLCQELPSPCSGHQFGCRELKFREVRRIKALCVGGPALLLWLHKAPVPILLGLCKESGLCHGLGLWQHSRNSPVSLVGRMVFVHPKQDAECSCFNDRTVLSSGSLLTRLPLAPWVLTSCSFQLLGPMVLPASMQQLWLQNPQVINLAAKDDKLVDLCSSLLCFWCVLVIGNYWFGGFLMLK